MQLINEKIVFQSFALGERFRTARPFPHLVLDDFFSDDFAQSLLSTFPAFDPSKAANELGEVGRKAVHTKLEELKEPYRKLDELFKSDEFLKFMSTITGIPELLYDPDYIGGGTHENLGGQELDPHVDFNYHPARKWHRRLNLLVYLNKEWQESWGGCIELHSNPWNAGQDDVLSFVPIMNRCVLFETSERSWHGFKKIQLPKIKQDISRKSIAVYFYSLDRPAEEILPEHATFYVHRPLPEWICAGYTLKEEDVQELKELLIKRDSWIKFLYDREIRFSSEMGVLRQGITQLKTALNDHWLKHIWRRFLHKFND
jgi:hypothetical protein